MNARHARGGYTLVELLLGLAIAAIILLPLADLLRTSADSARTVRSRLDLNADASFAIERIAASAAAAGRPEDAQQDWFALLGFKECKSTREVLEAASCDQPDRGAVVASNVDRFDLITPDSGSPTLRIALTLSHPDVAEPVTRVRTVRVGAHP